ncbi:hypothetical protein ACK6HG_004930, partial [Escherichia coli]
MSDIGCLEIQGASLEIANILGSKPGTIFTMLRDTGGIKPHERKRAV